MIVGGYDLHLYCDNVPEGPWSPEEIHGFNEFPHTDFGSFETGAQARALARKKGWLLNLAQGTALCPKCNPRSKHYIPDPR